ncbi:predicted protein [Thalassiosira pseudonana CCMP1335]|uniref:Uncharacterized protein n=1 Tax=Thalassiosira pseudonana TaxID=35128 RepID=B8C463_THAPS|nr:predicted protein [Thalassiosira pseudonana CCMP1335]EED91273.1 predicted protein [Thalassiosira pseudonana CCMP1335]
MTTTRRTRRTPSLLSIATLLLSQLPSTHAATTLIDSTGLLTKAIPSISQSGIVALLTSPGTTGSLFPESNDVSLDTASSDSSGGVIIKAPGACLEESSGLARGSGAAAAGSVAGAVVLSGVTLADAEVGLASTRHGRTLAELFASVVRSGKKGVGATLIIAVQDDGAGGGIDGEGVANDVEEIFESVAEAACVDDALGEYFKVEVVLVKDAEDVAKVMSKASSAASGKSVIGSDKTFSTVFADIYNEISSAQTADPTPVAEAALACNDAYSRASRTSRAKTAMWKHRVSRGLLVEKFGQNADSLMKRTLDLFDRDTMAAAGLPGAGEKRLEMRSKLQERTEKTLKELFTLQLAILEKSTLKKFNNALLRKMGKDTEAQDFFDNNAAALRSATFAFETSASTLEVPSLSLSKSKAVQDMTGKLNNALLTFPDSPAAKIKSMKKIEKTVSKKKQPSEGSIDLSLDLVAMIRPDGFGNLQGFAGYQLGPHSVTVGVHNDADDPGVISGFGGVRPPFIRVQPKLKLDVEL